MQNAGGGGRVHLRLQLNHTESTQQHKKKKKKTINQARTFIQTGSNWKTSVHKVSLLAALCLSIQYLQPGVHVCNLFNLLTAVWWREAEPWPKQLDLSAGQTLRNASHSQDGVFHRSTTSVLPSTTLRLCNYTLACMEASSNQPAVDMSLTKGVSPWRIFIAQRGAAQGNPKLRGWWMISMNILQKCITEGGKKWH